MKYPKYIFALVLFVIVLVVGVLSYRKGREYFENMSVNEEFKSSGSRGGYSGGYGSSSGGSSSGGSSSGGSSYTPSPPTPLTPAQREKAREKNQEMHKEQRQSYRRWKKGSY